MINTYVYGFASALLTDACQQTGYQSDYHKLISPDNLANTILAILTLLTLFVIAWQANMMNRQIALSSREYIANQRPRLVVRELQMVPPDNRRNARIRFIIANSGTSSAEVIESIIVAKQIESSSVGPLRGEGGAETIKDDLEHRNDLASLQPSLKIDPGSHIQFTHTLDFELPPAPGQLTPSGTIVHRPPGSGPKIVFRGRVVYKDANGTRRQMAFCRLYNQVNESFGAVEDYEYVD
jgi:hypothetical protein